ncbi:uncharacterized protein fgl2b isoform X2 [Neoarius graeffei]|uniref:uncharacterized protein fgl2b isoform X2 n=1 Tax=Neoarius graeffei TaxID=443677 RepID=UPI00298BF4C3|nr:uncharacterized protein fgl2b isoform X2 [Neoarius graeffei]
MWLSMLSVWGSLLTLVASQSCLDASENSASWVRLKPLGQCKDGESTCPYRITLPPLTVQLPKPFRELEKMARELQSLTQMVNKLKEDCRVCKERQGMDWNVRKDDEGEDGERIQAFRGALNTKEREQDIAERESTVQVTTPRSALEDTMIVSSNTKDVKPTVFGKQRNTNQERNVNPRTTKPRAETKQRPKGSNPLQKNQKRVSLGKIGYPVVTVVTEGDDDVVETTQLQTPKDDKVLGKKRLMTGTDAQNNRELEPNMKQLTRKQQDKEDKKEEAVDTGLKESRSSITEDTNNGNVAKEGSISVIQQPTLKNKGKKEKNNHGDSFTKPKPLKPGGYSERDAEVNSRSLNTDDTIRGQKKLTSPITDAKMDTGIKSKFNTAETGSGQVASRSPISGTTYGTVDVSPTNPQTLDSKRQLATAPDSESGAGINSNPAETVSGLKKSRSPISDRTNATADVDLISPKRESSNSQTSSKSSKNAELNTGMDSNPVNKTETVHGHETSRSPISGITDGIVDVHPTNPQILDSKNQFTTGTDSERDAVMDSNPVDNVDTINGLKNSRSPISGRPDATGDMDLMNPNKQSSNSQTAVKSSKESNIGMNLNPINRLKNSRSTISGSTDGTVDASPTNPQIVQSKNQLEASTDSGTDARVGSNPVNNVETISEEQTSRSPISGITDGIADASPTDLQILDGKNQFRTGTESESDAVKDPNPVIATVTEQMNSRSSISDRANYTADLDLINPLSLNSQNPFTHGRDVKSNTGMDSHPFNTSETVSRRQTPNSPISDRTDTDEVNQAYPGTLDGTFKNPFKPMINKERKAEKDSNPLNKVETNGPLEMPQLTVKGRADATVNVNPQIVYSNSENATVVSTPVNKVEIASHLETPKTPISDRDHAAADQINPQAMDSKKRLKPGTISERKAGMYPKRHNTTDTGSQRETSESPVSDSRLDVSDTNPSLNSNDDLPKRRFLPKSKLNMTQPRNGQINPMSIDTKRKKALMSNKTTSLRSDAITSGRHPPTGLVSRKLAKQQEIKNQPERTSPTSGLSLYKDRSHKKPYVLQKKPYILRGNPVNETEASGPGGTANKSGVIDYTMSKETTHVDSKTVSSPNNELNSTAYDTSQSVMPTLATQDIVDQAQLKRAKTAPTVEVLHKIINHQTESTSEITVIKPRLAKPGSSSGQDLVLDTVNNIGRDSQPPVVAETKGTGRRTGQTKVKTSGVDSNQENHKKPLRVGRIQNIGGKMPLVVVSSEKNELNYPTTAATPYTIKTEFKDKYSKMSQFTPTITPPHFMDQDHAKQAKTTSGAKVSNQNVHHRLKNSSQEMEPKRSHSDTGNKKLQNASNGQESNVVTDFQPSSLDSIQNRTTGSMAIIMDKVKASTVSKVSTMSKESTNENRAKDSNPVVIDKLEASTEANWVTPASDNAPFKDHRYSKTPIGSDDSVERNNGGHPIDYNNGNFNPVAVNRMTGATLHKIPAGHTNNEDNKKPLTISNMDDRQALEKQLLSNCHGPCDLGPTLQSALNSRESSDNKRDNPPRDCSDFILRNPTSGIYNVTPTASDNRTFPVFCDMKSSGGGWTLIQHRFDGSISFNRTWNDYKKGFGNLSGEFWLGNDKIHWLTTTKAMVLRIELEDLDGTKEYAQYDHFHVANESQFYRLTIDGYSGTAGNAMQYSKKFNHNQKNFTTPDRDNDQYASGNCGTYYSSGWWFDACFAANLNGKYYQTKYRGVRNGIFWGTWHNITTESYLTHDRQSFKTVRMMIRPRTGFLMD